MILFVYIAHILHLFVYIALSKTTKLEGSICFCLFFSGHSLSGDYTQLKNYFSSFSFFHFKNHRKSKFLYFLPLSRTFVFI